MACQRTSSATEASFSSAGINATKFRGRLLKQNIAMMAVITANKQLTRSDTFVDEFVEWSKLGDDAGANSQSSSSEVSKSYLPSDIEEDSSMSDDETETDALDSN